MAPPLTKDQEQQLKDLWYGGSNFFGRDRIFWMLKRQGSNISRRQVMEFLSKQEIHQTFRRPLQKTSVAPIVASKEGQYQCDTFDMSSQSWRGMNAVLSLIDIYSKKLYCRAIRAKTSAQATMAMRSILEENRNMKMSVVTVDNGGEFKSEFEELLRGKNVKIIRTKPHTPTSNSIVERSNATVRRQLAMYQAANDTDDWVSALPIVVESINNTLSFATGKSPNDLVASQEDSEMRKEAADKIYNRAARGQSIRSGTALAVGDTVRRVLHRTALDKPSRLGYFGPTKYKIRAIVPSKFANYAPSYALATLAGQPVRGLFSRSELLLIPSLTQLHRRPMPETADEVPSEEAAEADVEPEVAPLRRSTRKQGEYLVDYISQKRKKNRRIEYLVHWVGYDEPTWEPKSNLQNAKDALAEFESTSRR